MVGGFYKEGDIRRDVTKENPYSAIFQFSKNDDAKEAITGNKLNYGGIFIIDEVQSSLEFRTFVGITIFTVVFGLLVILILKPLKRLTHGVEDAEVKFFIGLF